MQFPTNICGESQNDYSSIGGRFVQLRELRQQQWGVSVGKPGRGVVGITFCGGVPPVADEVWWSTASLLVFPTAELVKTIETKRNEDGLDLYDF
jgi:hypothetical protein